MFEFEKGFVVKTAPVRVVFKVGALDNVGEELTLLGAKRAIVLSTSHQSEVAEKLRNNLGELSVGTFTNATMHTPIEVTQEAIKKVKELDADCTIAIGGGSTTGLGKAIAYQTDLPQIVIPTTYAGSEATAILGQTEDGIKTTLVDPKIQPETIIYDPNLLITLPVKLSVVSGLNAMAHAAEALYAKDRNPLSTQLALEGLKALKESLPAITNDPKNIEARTKSIYGAWLCGTVLGQVGMALHHKLCHTLGGSFDLPHAETHAIILAHAIAYNEVVVSEILKPLANLFNSDTAGNAIYEFVNSLNAPLALKDLGLAEENLDKAANIATSKPYWNPAEISKENIRKLLQNAWEGKLPSS